MGLNRAGCTIEETVSGRFGNAVVRDSGYGEPRYFSRLNAVGPALSAHSEHILKLTPVDVFDVGDVLIDPKGHRPVRQGHTRHVSEHDMGGILSLVDGINEIYDTKLPVRETLSAQES